MNSMSATPHSAAALLNFASLGTPCGPVWLPQTPPRVQTQREVTRCAPLNAEANALDRHWSRVAQDWFVAQDHLRMREDAETAFGEVAVNYSYMANAALAATRASSDLFADMDPAAYENLGNVTYTLDSDEE